MVAAGAGFFVAHLCYISGMSSVVISEFQTNQYGPVLLLMKEFCDYIESLDSLKQTHYGDRGAAYFTDKMIQRVNEMQGKLYVAMVNNRIVGFIQGHITDPDEDERMETTHKKIGIVDELFVTAATRGNGIGKQLISTIEIYFVSQHCDVVRLEVFAPNTSAHHFYSKVGYQDRMITVSKYFEQD